MNKNNPFLQDNDQPFKTIPFENIKLKHFMPALEQGIKETIRWHNEKY